MLPARLAAIGETIEGITTTQMDLVATQLAIGLDEGYDMRTVGTMIDAALGTEGRGEMIARTETCRAVEEAAQVKYAEHGVEQWQWLVGLDACPECEPFDGETFDVGTTEPSIPYHPNCRCTSAPVIVIDGVEQLGEEVDSGEG